MHHVITTLETADGNILLSWGLEKHEVDFSQKVCVLLKTEISGNWKLDIGKICLEQKTYEVILISYYGYKCNYQKPITNMAL